MSCAHCRSSFGQVTGRLTVHSANINEAGVFDEICEGAHGFVHSADQLMSAGGEEKGPPFASRVFSVCVLNACFRAFLVRFRHRRHFS